MCGIVGIVGEVNEYTLRVMTQTLYHRGPDDGAIWISKNASVGFGHRRLSIIDLSVAGRQPMQTANGRYTITYNGEIFNYRKIRERLIKKGFSFRSGTDTEVLLKGYVHFGKEILQLIHGQFAFAIWDEKEQKLFAARDRFGIKPFYYTKVCENLVFASELKSILHYFKKLPSINWKVLPELFSFLWIPHPETLFENIYKLSPGYYIEYQHGSLNVNQYWDLSFEENREYSESDAVQNLRRLIEDASQSQLMSDVPLGLLLSGGLDSTCLLASIIKTNPTINTFCATYKDLDRQQDLFEDDLEYAVDAAKHFDVDLKKMSIDANIENIIDDVVWHLDEPLGDPSVITNYLICKEAKSEMTVLLCGMGADEIFGGYLRYPVMQLTERYKRSSKIFSQLLYPLIKNIGSVDGNLNAHLRRIKLLVKSGILPFEERYLFLSRYSDFDKLSKLLAYPFYDFISDENVNSVHKQYFKNTITYSIINKLLYVDLKTFLPCLNLENMDKTSMAHSVEIRVPFLDEGLVDFTSMLPSDFKLNGIRRKYILRKAYEGIIPDKIIKRKKTGFSVPIRAWIKKDLAELIHSTLFADKFINRNLFSTKEISVLIEKNNKGIEDNSLILWQLFVFDRWMEIFVESQLRKPEKDPMSLIKLPLAS